MRRHTTVPTVVIPALGPNARRQRHRIPTKMLAELAKSMNTKPILTAALSCVLAFTAIHSPAAEPLPSWNDR